MTPRTYSAAFQIARQNPDRIAACKMLTGLLWHVEKDDGGFIGRTDEDLQAYCEADPRLSYAAAVAHQYAPPPWPPESVSQQRAA